MRNFVKTVIGIFSIVIVGLSLDITVYAAPGSCIESGVFADDINLSGMTAQEAEAAIIAKTNGRRDSVITLTDGVDYNLTFTGADVDYLWANKDIINSAVSLGKSGNIVSRFKTIKELEKNSQVFPISYSINTEALRNIISYSALEYNRDAVDSSLSRSEGEFQITEGQTGRALDEQTTFDTVADFLITSWDGSDATLDMTVDIVEPLGSFEDLSMVRDVLGTYTTSFSTSGSSRSANITNACGFIDGITLFPGEEFNTLDTITPFSEANGYYLAGSYLNGQVVESLGGGICQVSTTLYNAVLLAELEVSERHNHSMIISYVKPSMDAAIAESGGKNFRFINSTDYPIYIEGFTADKNITFTIYGVESRPSTHKVTYESQTIETDVPEQEVIYTDASKPAGYSSGAQSAHIGYKAKLWKNTYENGELVSRDEVNSSTYNKSPRSITIGVATDNADLYNMLMGAAASGSVDTAAAAASQAAAIVAAQSQPAEATEAPQ